MQLLPKKQVFKRARLLVLKLHREYFLSLKFSS